MTQGQRKLIHELMYSPLCMRLSRRERAEVERITQLPENTVLSVELAGWLEKIGARVKKVSGQVKR